MEPYNQDLIIAAIEHRQMHFFLKDEMQQQYKQFLAKPEQYKESVRAQVRASAVPPRNSCEHDVPYKYACVICDRHNALEYAKENNTQC